MPSHSLFLSRPGGVLACGAGECGQCGNGLLEEANPMPTTVDALDATPCCFVGSGNFHSVALSREDGLYTSVSQLNATLCSNIKSTRREGTEGGPRDLT